MRQYIGVTGFAYGNEASGLFRVLDTTRIPTTHEVVAGVLVSDRTLAGGSPPAPRYPAIQDAYLLLATLATRCRTAIHFNTRQPDQLVNQIALLFSREEAYERNICRRIQLNVGSPELHALEQVLARFPELEIIIQVPLWVPTLREEAALAAFAERYRNKCHWFLVDPSGGRGTGIAEEVLPLVPKFKKALGDTANLAIAGGLSGETVRGAINDVRKIGLRDHFSIDAEGKLRGGSFEGSRVGDRINPGKVEAYLREASAALE